MAEQPPKKWILNAFAMFTPGHLSPGLWRHPKDRGGDFNDLSYWTDLAKLLDENGFHGLFLADHLGIYDVYKGPANATPSLESGAQFPLGDPFLLVSAMAAATKSLNFAITSSTTYESPYITARKYSTLDHLTKGRIGWNLVTSYLDSAANAFGLEEQIPHDERYARAEEYINVVYKLLEGSWRDDALVKDKSTGQYSDSTKVKRIEHVGKYYKCSATHQLPPSLQRTPFILQAGASSAGKAFATKHSEAMFLPGSDTKKVKNLVDDIRAQTVKNGRSAGSIKLIVGVTIIVDETDELAQAKYQEYLSYSDIEGVATLFGGWTDHDLSKYSEDEDFKFTGAGAIQSMINTWSATIPGTEGVKWTKRRVLQELGVGGFHFKAIGSPKTVADTMQKWVDETGVDGFNIAYAISPGSFEDIAKFLLPELRRRGVFWEDYETPGASMRETFFGDGKGPKLRDDHPGASFTWRAERTERDV